MVNRICKIENLVIFFVINIIGMYVLLGSGWRFKYIIISK